MLLEAGASIDAVDDDGNSPLHVMCYGEEGKDTQHDCIEILVSLVILFCKRFILYLHVLKIQYCLLLKHNVQCIRLDLLCI